MEQNITAIPKISVLLAVYNASKYLSQCLDSLLCQTLSNIQIICVDDCSTDNSLSMLRDYERRDSRVVVLHQDVNTGQGHARNYALQYATGEYIAFLDSDDQMSSDCLEQAAKTLDENPDTGCVLLHVKFFMENHNKYEDYPMEPFLKMSGQEAFEKSLEWSIHGCYVARRQFYEDDPYDDSCHSYSDDNTTRLHYFKSREVRCCEGIYYYRIHPSSVTHQPTIRRFDWMKANESMKRQLILLGVEDRIMCQWESSRLLILVDCYYFYYCNAHRFSPSDRQYALAELHRIWNTIDRSKLRSPKVKKFGYRLMPSWTLFRLQEWFYFTLRRLLFHK